MMTSGRALLRGLGERLHRLPAYANLAVSLALLSAVWRFDRLTGTQVSMSILYLVPISFSAWFCGSSWAYAISFMSACAWLQADLLAGHRYFHWIIPYWNATVRLGFFVIVTVMSASIMRLRRLGELEHAAKKTAEDASQLKSNMLSFVSHEFGNSLTTLKLSLILLKESESESVSQQRTRCYEILERGFNHLNAAVANFLNANRLETGRFQPEIRRVPIRSLVHNTLSVLEPVVESKNVHLKLDFPSHPVPVRADPDALSLVMSNLIGNAFKYTPAGGAVTVRIAPEKGPAPKVLVSVEDTGIGISPEDQKKLFAGFYRTERGKETAKGFGVGLKVAHDLLASMGSQLGLKSASGKGSRFFFHLPLWVEESASSKS